MKAIGIVGKREFAPAARIRDDISSAIARILAREGDCDFLARSAMAKGADTIFADVVTTEFGQPVEVVLPFDIGEYEKDFEDAESLTEFRDWIKKLGVSQVLTKKKPENQRQREDAYFLLGTFLCETCDYVIFVWDGEKPNGRGGTADILGYASKFFPSKTVEVEVQPLRTDDVLSDLRRMRDVSDGNAIAAKYKFENVWIASIILGVLAIVCLAVGFTVELSPGSKLLVSVLELSFVTAVVALVYIARVTSLHSTVLNERVRAEKLRILIAHYHANVPISVSEITSEADAEFSGIVTRANSAIDKAYYSQWYTYRIVKSLISEQMKYHGDVVAKTIAEKPKRFNNVKNLIYFIWFYLLVSQVFSLFINYFQIQIPILSDYPYPAKASKFLIIVLPAVYAALKGISYLKQWHNLKDQSTSMLAFLSVQLKRLEECGINKDEVPGILNLVSSTMLAENKDWVSLLNSRESPSPVL